LQVLQGTDRSNMGSRYKNDVTLEIRDRYIFKSQGLARCLSSGTDILIQ